MQTSSPDPALDPARLRSLVAGTVIGPDDPDYDRGRSSFYGGFDRHPAAIVRVAGASDIARVVTLAAERDIELSVRSGGHSLAAHGISDGGIVIDLSDMKALDINVEERTAWAETGLTTGEYTSAAGVHGLATGFGDTASVGIGGLTLSGGIGLLVRKYGLTIDNVLAAEVVTADGQVLQVDEEHHPDLFWAIRGGGGNFGVVTRIQYRLHEVDRVLGGMLVLPATPEVVAGFVAEAEAAPEALSTIANVMVAPPMPFLPPDVHGKLVIAALVAFDGDLEVGQRTLSRMRALAEPLADTVAPIRYPELFEEAEELHPTVESHTSFRDTMDEDTARTILEYLERSTAPMSTTQLRVLGGAAARVPADATAFAHRHRRLMTTIATMFEAPEDAPQHRAWVRGLATAIREGEDGAYAGFVQDDDAAAVQRAYPPATYDRLRQVKQQYDPGNLFRMNLNIPLANGTR